MFKVVLVFPESVAGIINNMVEELFKYGFAVQAVYVKDGAIVDEAIKRQLLSEANIYITGNYEPIRAEDMDEAPSLKLIQRFGSGYDNVDVQAATQRGIYVANAPLNSDSVADLTMGLMLALLRHIPRADAAVRRGIWRLWIGHELAGKKLGVLGLGTIGKKVAQRAKAFEMTVLAYDPCPDYSFAQSYDVILMSREELLKTADIVSLHLPLTPETRFSFGEAELKMMKRSAYLINTARGGIVDQQALIRALHEGWISGAALDVFSVEPPNIDDDLLKMENVVLTSHIGGATFEALDRMVKVTIENCLRILRGEPPLTAVNRVIKRGKQ
jgi:D-3-phosphoglycerate dehydrogenase